MHGWFRGVFREANKTWQKHENEVNIELQNEELYDDEELSALNNSESEVHF